MSNPNVDLEAVITDSITDSQLPPDTDTDTPEVDTSDISDDTSYQVETPATADDAPAEDAAEGDGESRVDVPDSEKAPGTKDEFERLAGMPAVGQHGRENRIPYSRVKKITEKAVNELAENVLGRKLAPGEKAADVVKQYAAEIPVMREKVTDYEARLERVGQFEDIIQNKPKDFIKMLQKLPQYEGFFSWIRSLRQDGHVTTGGDGTAGQAAQAAMESDQMPEPDQALEDGTKVYSLDGLKQLLLWNSKDTERRVLGQVESQYAPIRSEFQQRREAAQREMVERQQYEAALPVIRRQIEDAKTWPMFSENEDAISEALAADESLSLEGAYRKVVLPKILSDRQAMRQQVMKEIKTAPRAASVPSNTAQKATPSTGPKSLEDVIREQVATLK